MKAIVQNGYGSLDVLSLQDVEAPRPTDDQVLVAVRAASVNYGNLALVAGKPLISRLGSGWSKPNYAIPGGDIAGQVMACGKNVTRLKKGDAVYGDLSSSGWGGFAEYVCAAEGDLALMPQNITYAEAAAVPQAALVALQGLRDKGHIQAGQSVLIHGASGGNGTFAVQIAKAYGAVVTGVCSAGKAGLVRSLGADYVIDYMRTDFASGSKRYDLILSTAGDRSIRDYRKALRAGGTYVSVGGAMRQVMQGLVLGPVLSLGNDKTLTSLYHRPNVDDLATMTESIASGQVVPVIDRVFPLSETSTALEYYAKGRSQGKVVIAVDDTPSPYLEKGQNR